MSSRVPLVTASYIDDGLRSLGVAAEEGGVPILAEMGLDPGMDHMSAMRIIDGVKSAEGGGGRVTSFSSLCGGLPSPEAANNPLLYKFSWSPQGVLNASQNAAKYLQDGQLVEIPPEELLRSARPCDASVSPLLQLEHLPNRDSTYVREPYGLEGAATVYRGTLRYAGWCSLFESFRAFGLADSSVEFEGGATPATWGELILMLKGAQWGFLTPQAEAALLWLGVDDASAAPLPAGAAGPMECLAALLTADERMFFGEGERDMVVMHHEILSEREDPDSSGRLLKERHTSSLTVFGDERASSMARTVGLATAIGAEVLLEGADDSVVAGGSGAVGGGVIMPVAPEVYVPALGKLEVAGLVFEERTEVVAGGIYDAVD